MACRTWLEAGTLWERSSASSAMMDWFELVSSSMWQVWSQGTQDRLATLALALLILQYCLDYLGRCQPFVPITVTPELSSGESLGPVGHFSEPETRTKVVIFTLFFNMSIITFAFRVD